MVESAEPLFSVADVISLLIFLCLVWLAGRAAVRVSLPSLVGELVVGALLGPPLADFVPQPAAVALAGQCVVLEMSGEKAPLTNLPCVRRLGLILLVVESGLEVQLADVKQVGLRGICIAFAGSVFGPFLVGIGIAKGVGLGNAEALAVGASLSPTSMGVSVFLFKEARIMNTPLAQLIMSAAVTDDIIGLVLLSEIAALRTPSAAAFVVPVVSAVAFFVGCGAAAFLLLPRMLAKLLPFIPAAHVETAILGLLGLLVVGLAAALDAGRASYLLGCFLAGLSFASLHSVHGLWAKQVKRVQSWLLRLFFAATVGFVIPIRHFWTGHVWALALALWCGTTAAKALTGVFAKPQSSVGFLLVSCAMSVRGEFAFLVANTAFSDGSLGEQTHASVMLAIVISLIVGPASLRSVLLWRRRRMDAALADAELEAAAAARERAGVPQPMGRRARVYYLLEVRCRERWALMPDLLRVLAHSGVEVLDCRTSREGEGALGSLEAFARDDTLFDYCPETCTADGLDARLSELAERLFGQLSHDPAATCTVIAPGDERAWAAQGAPPPSELRGLRLQRWLPGAT
jgi:Kef-type K+ transport system membrane component KefB